MRKLMRDMKGSVITSTVLAERMAGEAEFKGKIKIEAMPVSSQSFYLAFSKKSGISPEDRERIWNRIRELREDYVYMLQLFAQY